MKACTCMLLVAVFFTAADDVLGLNILSDLVQVDQTCRKESGFTQEDFGELYDFNVAPSAKCYLKCIFSQFGIWKNGLDVKAFMSKLRKVPLLMVIGSKVQKALNQCSDVSGANECEQAFNVAVCLAATVYKDHGNVIRGAYKIAKG